MAASDNVSLGETPRHVVAAFFCPQAKAPSAAYLQGVHLVLSKSAHGRELLRTISQLKSDNIWAKFASSWEDVGNLTTGPRYIDMLYEWAVGGTPDELAQVTSGIVALPLLLIVQIAQYFCYLETHGISHGSFLHNVSSGGLQGYCGGLPAAMAISCAKDEMEVVQHTATAMRIVLGIGAYGEAADDSGGTGSTTLALRLKYEGQGTDIVSKFPGTHISAVTDMRSISIVGPSARLHELFLYAKELEGVQVQKMDVRGQVHNPDNAEIAVRLSQFCARDPSLTLPDASSLQVQVRSNITGARLKEGPLTEELITTVLASRCEWYRLLTNLAKDISENQQMTPDFAYFGLTDCVPLLPFHKLGIRPNKSAVHPLIKPPRQVHQFNDNAIAVVGASCRLPGANNMQELWQMLAKGEDQHQELPTDRFDLRGSFRTVQSGSFAKDRTFYGNFIDDVGRFDHSFFGVNPREAANMDPQQRILLELAYEALEDSGYIATHQRDRGDNVGCFIGASFVEYLDNTNAHPPTAYTSTGTIRAFLCGRISYYYGWSGPAEVIDTACSSSLVAINRACKAVQNGECEMALAGGINIIAGMNNYFDLAKAGFLSPTGQCKPFDVSADGYCRSDGAGLVVLKKLKDAIAQGDSILGVIAGTATNQGGLSSSITVPHSIAQQKLYRQVLSQAGLPAERVTYVETHGTGTQAGDPLEIESIRSIFRRAPTKQEDVMYIGSIKGNIGHCETAAGVAGLLKVLTMIKHRQLPGQANHKQLNPKIAALTPDGLAINNSVRSWDAPLRASLVNSYGAAGSNAALLCCEWQPEQEAIVQRSRLGIAVPIMVEAATTSALLANAHLLGSHLRENASAIDLNSIAAALHRKRTGRHKLRAIIEATSIHDAASQLSTLGVGQISEQNPRPNPVVLLMSGQYDDKVGLNKSLYDDVPAFRYHVDVCDAEVVRLGYSSLIPTLFDTQPAVDIVMLQCSIFAMQYASAQCWIAAGVKPAAIIGHSLGELTGLAVAGVLSLADAMKLVATRAQFIREKVNTDNGAMLALSGCSPQDYENISRLLEQKYKSTTKLEVACYNAPTALVVAGASGLIEHVEDLLHSEPTLSKIRVRRLSTTHGFHSSLMEPILPDLETFSKTLCWRQPKIPLETCTPNQQETFDEYSPSLHVRNSVYFASAVQRVEERLGPITWLEAGIDTPVVGMVAKAVMTPRNHKFIAVRSQGDSPVNGANEAVKTLRAAGINVTLWTLLPSNRQHGSNQHIWLPPYQFDRANHWLPNVDRVMEMQAEVQKGMDLRNSDPIVPEPTKPAQLVGPRPGSDPGLLGFVINTCSKRFQSVVGGHAVRGKPLCPASMYMESVVAALQLHLGGDWKTKTADRAVRFRNLNINAPLGRETDGEVVIQLRPAKDDFSWSFTVRTIGAHAGQSKVTSHASGEVTLTASPDFDTLQRLAASLMAGIQKSSELEKLLTKRAYDLFGRVVKYANFFKGISSISMKEHEALAEVRLPDNQPSREESSVWKMSDTVALDSFIQVVGLLMNSDDKVGVDEVVVMVGLESSTLSADFDVSDSPEYWKVYAKFEIGANGQPIGDVFVSTPDGKLVATMCGCKFMNLPMAKLEKLLDAANRVSVKPSAEISVTVSAASSTSSSVGDDTSSSVGTGLTGYSTPNSGETLLALVKLAAEYTGTPADGFPTDKSLMDLGLDSLASVELIEELQTTYGVSVDPSQLGDMSISDLCKVAMPDMPPSLTIPALESKSRPAAATATLPKRLSNARSDQFLGIIAEITGAKVTDIKPTDTLMQLGVDSLSAIDLKQEIEDKFSARLPDSLIECTVSELMLAAGIESPALASESKHSANAPDLASQVELSLQSHRAEEPSLVSQNPFTILKESDIQFDDSARRNGFLGYWTNAAPLQNRLMLAYIIEAFTTLGVDLREFGLGQSIPQVPFLAGKYDKLVSRLWKVLQRHDIVSINGESVITRGPAAVDRKPASELHQEFVAQCPRYQDEAALMNLTGPALANCLIGKADGVRLMFGSAAAMKIMADYYSQSPMISTLTDQLVVFMTSLLRTAGGRQVRILEVGAGTGGTTRRLAAALTAAGCSVSYTFSDISPSLVSKAKSTLAQYPWMEFTTFDLEKEVPAALLGRYDVVIGTNCVHATSDCTATCRRLRQTLNPAGILVLSEVTTVIDWYDISFGLLDGWWLGEHGTAYPIRPASAWASSFRNAGFSAVGSSGGSSRESTSQQLLVACNKHWDNPVQLAAAQSVGDRLQSHVETMVYKEVDGIQIHADVFVPATDHGKPLPVAIMIHGGGHITLSRRAIRPFQTEYLLDNGFLPMSIDYRLCPEVNLVDGPIADVRDAYKWAKTSLPALVVRWGIRVDTSRVVVIGWSTGGHLATTLGWTSKYQNLPPPTAVLSFYAPYDFESGGKVPARSEHHHGSVLMSRQELDKVRLDINMQRQMKLEKIVSALPSKPITNYDNSARGDSTGLGWIRPGDPRSELVLAMFKDGIGPSLLLQGLPRPGEGKSFEEHLRQKPPPELVASVSPVARLCAGEYNCPTYVIHGTSDEIAPFSGAQRFVEKLAERNIRHGFLALPNAKHIHDVGIECGSSKWDAQIGPGYRFLFETVQSASIAEA